MTSCAFTRGESNSGRESDFGTTPDVIWTSFLGLNQVGPSWPYFRPKIDVENWSFVPSDSVQIWSKNRRLKSGFVLSV